MLTDIAALLSLTQLHSCYVLRTLRLMKGSWGGSRWGLGSELGVRSCRAFNNVLAFSDVSLRSLRFTSLHRSQLRVSLTTEALGVVFFCILMSLLGFLASHHLGPREWCRMRLLGCKPAGASSL